MIEMGLQAHITWVDDEGEWSGHVFEGSKAGVNKDIADKWGQRSNKPVADCKKAIADMLRSKETPVVLVPHTLKILADMLNGNYTEGRKKKNDGPDWGQVWFSKYREAEAGGSQYPMEDADNFLKAELGDKAWRRIKPFVDKCKERILG